MAKFTEEQKEAQRESAAAYIKAEKKRKNALNLPSDMIAIADDYGRGAQSKIGIQLKADLKSGKYKKPSEFVKARLAPMLGAWIPKALVPSMLYEIDNVLNYPYAEGWCRRSFRSDRYDIYTSNICNIIERYSDPVSDATFPDYIQGKVSKPQMDCFCHYELSKNPYDIAYNIDTGNTATIEYVSDILGGGLADEISYEILKGVFMAKNHDLHVLAGKLLLAAKLQEGLRQAICETCDMGCLEAFRYMSGVIAENDLIRFSSVKRAIGTWTGLMPEGCKDLDRISGKTLDLILQYLDNDDAVKEALKTDDAIKIHLALWARSVINAHDVIDLILEISANGTHQQVMTAAYFTRELFATEYKSEIAKAILFDHPDELDVTALVLSFIISRHISVKAIKTEGAEALLLKSFAGRSEAEKVYSVLLSLLGGMSKKSVKFDPCVFPWNVEEITKDDITRTLISISALLDDDAKKDELCPMIDNLESAKYSKSNDIELLLFKHKTDMQKDTLVSEICDKESWSRDMAFKLIPQLELSEKHYLMLEDMLRYKASDVRERVIGLLMKMEDDKLYLCAERLVSDKKEEKRTAGLDIIMQIGKDEGRKLVFSRCLPLTSLIKEPTTKEQILIDQLYQTENDYSYEPVEGYGLYTSHDVYKPVLDKEYIAECMKVFEKYFPSSELIASCKDTTPGIVKKLKNLLPSSKHISSGKDKENRDHIRVIKALDDLIELHKNDEYTNRWGEKELLGNARASFGLFSDNDKWPFAELWDEFYDEYVKGDNVLLFRCSIAILHTDHYFQDFAFKLFGREFEERLTLAHGPQISSLFASYFNQKLNKDELRKAAFAMMYRLYEHAEKTDFFVEVPGTPNRYWKPTYHYVKKGRVCKTENKVYALFDEPHINRLRNYFSIMRDEDFPQTFALWHMLCVRLGTFELAGAFDNMNNNYLEYFPSMSVVLYIRAAYQGIISEGFMYRHMFEEQESFCGVIDTLCGFVARYRDSEIGQRHYYKGGMNELALLLCDDEARITDESRPLAEYGCEVYEKVLGLVLDSELKRGDSASEFTRYMRSVKLIYGTDRFVKILSALGRDTFGDMGGGYSWQNTVMSKRSSLSHLLTVCVPRENENSETLRALIKGTDITDKRLVEAALYSDSWIHVVGEYLGWEGFDAACYYFISHMNEHFTDKQKALFAKYTPIPTEELAAGAFDINWFRETYDTIGEKHFNMIYDAAKYITVGAKHTRARKYADAVRGKLPLADAEKQIHEKRNKDTLMASALIPLNGDEDVLYRYKLFMQFKKESSKFGAQRKASESLAVDMALRNLAVNAGYIDVTRLTMRMETMMFDDIRHFTEPQALDDVTLRLVIDDLGGCDIECAKGGKVLKSIPAKHKKSDLVLTLIETKKMLIEQHRRTRLMFEQAMEDMVSFTAGELQALTANPVVAPIIKSLVLTDGKASGLLDDMKFVSANGSSKKLKEDASLRIAHPFDLYNEGSWRDWQKFLFDKHIVQSFKQVFRELYVKTEDEKGAYTSLRYAGNQIQPQKTAACLKSRRWIADVEDGLQKVYYKQNIIARIYALADWFSPADIEAPTLEWVDFFDRKTGKNMNIDDIPEILFSEVMRDVDLAVSVAHAGGVDPEASHSTVELRRAVCEFTLPLFGITNVTFEKNHAFITGKLADYSINLGSGVVHIQGGTMINILPVHSQHRGRLFLPFVDDDPKTAQIISEILLFADDKSIVDPFILQQIR